MPRFSGTPIGQVRPKGTSRFGGTPISEEVKEPTIFSGLDDLTSKIPKQPTQFTEIPEFGEVEPGKVASPTDVVRETSDISKGLVEGPAGLMTGIGAFLSGVPIAAPKVLEGIIAGDPITGLAEAGKELDKVMEAFTLQPESRFGQTIMEVGASPFAVAHAGIDKGVRALGGEDREVKAAQFAFDAALFALPHLRGKLRRGEKLARPEIKEIKDQVKVEAPELPEAQIDALDSVLDSLKIEADKVARESAEVRFEGNVDVVEAIRDVAATKEGFSKQSLNKAARIVSELGEGVETVDLGNVKGIGPKTQKIIDDALGKREGIEPVKVVKEEVPGFTELPTIEFSLPEKGQEFEFDGVRFKYDGQMENPGGKPLQLVTPKEGQAKDATFAITEVTESVFREKYLSKVEEFKDTPQLKVGEAQETVTPHSPVEEPLPTFDIPEFETQFAARQQFDIGSEITTKQALKEAKEGEGTEFGVAKIGDRHFRTVEKVDAPERPEVFKFDERTAEELIEETLDAQADQKFGEPVRKPESTRRNGKDIPKEVIPEAIKVDKDSYVEKINEAKPENPTNPQDVGLYNEEFQTFKTIEETQAYKEATGVEGGIIPVEDGFTIYSEKLELEDYRWDGGIEEVSGLSFDERIRENDIDFGESSDGGVRNLIDLMNNERGAVDITPLRLHVEKIKEIQKLARKLGKSVDEVADMLALSDQAREQLKVAFEQLPKDEQEIQRLDPITDKILNPPKDTIISQGSKKTSKGIVDEVPLTQEWADKVSTASLNDWGKDSISINPKTGRVKVRNNRNLFQAYMGIMEIRPNAFRRYGMEDLWTDWTHKLTDAKRFSTDKIKVSEDLKKTLTNEEVTDMGKAIYADQKGGPEALASMGITDIPTMNPKQLEAINFFRGEFDILLDQINYVRSKTGRKPIPKLRNYFTMIHMMNSLRDAGITESLTTMPLRRVSALQKEFQGVFNPYAKERKVTDIPIELDVFKAYEKYVEQAAKEIHVAPIGALSKTLANADIPGKGKLADTNPGLAKLLNDWGDEIMGHDPISDAFAKKYPRIKAAETHLHRNIVAAMIFGNVPTYLKQAAAFTGTIAEAGLLRTLEGIGISSWEKPAARLKGERTRAKDLSNVLEIRRADIAITEFQEAVKTGKVSGVKQIAGEITAAPINIVDAFTAEASWNAFYNKATKDLNLEGGYRGSPAAKYADMKVVRTQAMGIKGASSPIQTIPGARLGTILQTFAINDFNYIAQDLLGIKNPDRGNKGQVARVTRFILAAAFANAVYNMMGILEPHPSPIEAFRESLGEGLNKRQAAANAILELGEKFPIIGGALRFGTTPLGPAGELASDIGEVPATMINMMDWDNMTEKQKLNAGLLLWEVMGTATGIPMTNQIRKSIRTASQGGNTWEIIVGVYIEEKKRRERPTRKSRPKRPRFQR